MSGEEVTYSTLRFLNSSSKSRNRVRPDGSQPTQEAEDKEYSVPWRLLAVAAGILCLLLSMTIALLVTRTFQCNQEKYQQQEILENLHKKNNEQNCSNLKEQMMTHSSSERHDGMHTEEPDSLSSDRCYKKNVIIPNSLQNKDKTFERWFCCGVKCYYFTVKEESWRTCKKMCSDSGLSLLRIDDKDELTFLKSQAHPNSYWTGFCYDTTKNEWTWTGHGTSNLNLTSIIWLEKGKCLFLSSTRIDIIDCERTFHCICEKRMDK